MSYLILRTEKLRGWGSIKAMSAHHDRSRETLNADPDRIIENRTFVGTGDPAVDVRNRIEESGAALRNDSVLAIEVLMTASPEWWAESDEDQEQEFCWRSVEWTQRHFGRANLVSAILHRDESTPHMHLVVVPVDDSKRKRGPSCRLNAKRWLGGKAKLSAMQTSAAEAFNDLGLERGIEGSKARHTTVRQFYGEITRGEVPELMVNTPPHALRESKRQEWAEAETARLRIVHNQIVGVARASRISEKKSRELEATIKSRDEALRELKARTSQLRDIPVDKILEHYGWHREGTKFFGPDGHGDIGVNGQLWNHFQDGKGGGGSIDLVMHLEQCDFRQATAILADLYGEQHAARAVAANSVDVVHDIKATVKAFEKPAVDESRWPEVRQYLVQKRGLVPGMLDNLHRVGRIYADSHGNMVAFNGSCVAEKRGTGPKPFRGLATGSKRALEGSLSVPMSKQPKEAVFVESAIDLLSYIQLRKTRGPDYVVMSTAGAISKAPYIQYAIDQGYKVTCAFDNDDAGNENAMRMKAFYGDVIERELPPHGKDWNEALLHEMKVQQAKAEEAKKEKAIKLKLKQTKSRQLEKDTGIER